MNAVEQQIPSLTTDRLLMRAPNERDIPAWFARATDREAASLAGDPIPANIKALRDSHIVVFFEIKGGCEASELLCEFVPSIAHGLWSRWFIVAVPASKSGAKP